MSKTLSKAQLGEIHARAQAKVSECEQRAVAFAGGLCQGTRPQVVIEVCEELEGIHDAITLLDYLTIGPGGVIVTRTFTEIFEQIATLARAARTHGRARHAAGIEAVRDCTVAVLETANAAART